MTTRRMECTGVSGFFSNQEKSEKPASEQILLGIQRLSEADCQYVIARRCGNRPSKGECNVHVSFFNGNDSSIHQ